MPSPSPPLPQSNFQVAQAPLHPFIEADLQASARIMTSCGAGGAGLRSRGGGGGGNPPRRNAGLWCVSTRRDQHKAQKEMWLVSGLQDHRYLSVNKDAKMLVDVPLKKQSSVKTQRYVSNQRHAAFTGSICQPVTENPPPPPAGAQL